MAEKKLKCWKRDTNNSWINKDKTTQVRIRERGDKSVDYTTEIRSIETGDISGHGSKTRAQAEKRAIDFMKKNNRC